MIIYLYIAAGVVATGTVAYFINPTARSWLQGIWRRWFKDSEVNLAADAFTALGMIGELAADPDISQLFASAGISPSTLLIIGVLVRFLRMSRDRKMVPLTRDE